MVDANGKAYESNCVNNVNENASNARQTEVIYEDAHIGAVANLSPYHHLNG
jgi:hypothetical protein